MVKVCIFGGGAIGGYIAAHLARARECEVGVVARGATLDAIRADGLRVETPKETFSTPVMVTDETIELGVQDYVFLTLKEQQLDAALAQLTPLIGPNTVILPPTTGIPHYFFHDVASVSRDRPLELLDPGGRQRAAMPASQCLGVAYWIGAHGVAPGVVRRDGDNAGCPIGEIDGGLSQRARTITALLTESGVNSRLRDNIRGDIWVKFVNSLCWNPVAVLGMATVGEISGADGVSRIVRTMMEEADAIGRAIGLTIPYPPEQRIALTQGAPAHKMSMLQDFKYHRDLELDVLDRSIRAAAQLADMATPTLDTVLAMAKLRAATAASRRKGLS